MTARSRPGWVSGRILHVDLSMGTVRVVGASPEVYRLLYGGRGLAALLLYKLLEESGVPEPLEPENPLIIAPGLLTGSGLSTASKTTIAGVSPQTGLLGRSSVGARLGVALRYAGYDALIVTGALEEPGLLLVEGGRVRVEPARGLWGLGVFQANRTLANRYKGWARCVIGPAGENLSRIALIDCEGRQAGRTGLGAVMGSKQLKAILVRGARRPKPARPEEASRLVREWARLVPSTSSSKTLVEYGTPIVVGLTEPQGVFPSLNWRRSTLSWCPDRDEARRRYIELARSRRVHRNPCPHCNRPCSQVIRVRHPLTGEEVEYDGPEYELLYSLGSNLGFCDPERAAELAVLADDLGFDGISLGGTLAWLLEAAEKGVIPKELLEPYEGITWGRLEPLARLAADMAYRRGRLASTLADGSLAASRALGGGELAVHSKGLELPAYDARGLKGLALGYAVSSRGGDHLTSGMYAVELGGKLWIYENVDPLSYAGKAHMVRAMENLFAAYDNLGVCKFSRKELPPGRLAEAVTVFLGFEATGSDVLLSGERTVTLERLLITRLGLTREMDTLPPRLLSEPIADGPRMGELVEPGALERMKSEYYLLRGWDEKGVPTRETLTLLGLDRLVSEGTSIIEGRPL